MDIRGLKQSDILDAAKPFCQKYNIKLNKSDLSQFVNGKVEPGQWKLTILGLALNVSESWLMGLDVPMERDNSISNIIPLPDMAEIPLIGAIACGTPITAEENLDGYIRVPSSCRADFALTCKGDSMTGARIMDGDVVLIRQQPDVDDGEIAAVLIDGEATLKRVYKLPGRLILRPENPLYQPLDFSGSALEDIRILGKAVYFISLVK